MVNIENVLKGTVRETFLEWLRASSIP